ncbi:MAG: tetratricopeptide repeat protein [Chthonomonas sp.]|nr:tetratricopeptide repeat protein [Chthonomonas sp.]
MRQYMVLHRRGDVSAAHKLLQEAISVAPGSAAVILANAEDLVSNKQIKAAATLLKEGLELYPKDAKLETLYGELVLRIAGVADLMAPSEFQAMAQGGKVPVFLAAIMPGAGHAAVGEFRSGLGYFGVFVVCLLWIVLTPEGLSGIAGQLGLNKNAPPVGPIIWLPVVVGFINWVTNIADVSTRIKRMPVMPIERPTPPSDQSFEL